MVDTAKEVAERKVMLAIDESDYSHYALMWVLENLKESLAKSSLVIIMAQPPPRSNITFSAGLGSARMYCPVSTTQALVNSVKENQNKLTLALLEKAKDICLTQGVRAETIAEEGDPRTAICNAVQKQNISLLVLGEKGLGKLKRSQYSHARLIGKEDLADFTKTNHKPAILGSVSNYCVQYAKCPVLIVKKPK